MLQNYSELGVFVAGREAFFLRKGKYYILNVSSMWPPETMHEDMIGRYIQ
jgi:hypothetical protein